MKILSKFSAAFGLLILPLCAEENESYGFLNVVNLIPSANACEIQLAGKNLVPNGLKPAAETGWFMIPTGSKSISISHTEHKSFRSELNITEGISNLILIFLEAPEHRTSESKAEAPKIRIASFPAYEWKSMELKAISTFPGANRFQLGRSHIEMEYLKITDLPKWRGAGFQIHHNGKLIGSTDSVQDRACYYLVLSTDHRGNYLTTIVNGDTQRLPPWMKKSS